jgi:predicted methyltransferase
MKRAPILALVAALIVGGCTTRDGTESDSAVQSPNPAIAAALAHRDRPDADREADARRKPGAVLQFFGIEPGMTVLDLYSGTGYYTEILYRIVGDEGAVWAHNNTPYLRNVEPLAARYADGRLAAVVRITAENNELELPADTFDAVLMILTYHDIYFVNEAIGWQRIDGPALLAELFRAMKPGAVLGIVDHVAAPGSPPETGNTLHRIDPSLVRRELEAAGFVYEAASDVLRNPDDDLMTQVFNEQIRGRTDRFVFRFRKPG